VLLLLLAAVLVLQVLALRAHARQNGAQEAGLAERIERVEREVRMQLQATAQTSHAPRCSSSRLRRQLEAQGWGAKSRAAT
jgi:DNA recombination protein RmuC